MAVKISSKYKRTADLYKYFARDYVDVMDFSQDSLEEIYIYESQGKGFLSQNNGYSFGKRNMDISVTSWVEDIENGYLFVHELYEDENLPHWFLDKVLTKYKHRPKSQQKWDEKMEAFRKELMPNYYDKHGRLHDKYVTDNNPFPCNNSFLYSGEASVVGVPLDAQAVFDCYDDLCRTQYGFNRNPDGKTLPASSHDEIVGLFMLGKGRHSIYGDLKRQHFQVCNVPGFVPTPLYKLNPFKVISDFRKLSREDNPRKSTIAYPYIWPITFYHMPHHQYFYARCADVRVGIFRSIYFFLAGLFSILHGSNSSRVMLGFKLLKLKKLGQTFSEKLLTKIYNRKLKFGEEVFMYFPDDHPIVKAAGEKL